MDTAGVASANQTADMLEKMTLDSQNKASNVADDVKKPADRKFGPLHKGNATNRHGLNYGRSTKLQPRHMDQSMHYTNTYPYFYGAYDGTTQDWDKYRRYFQADGAENKSVGNGYMNMMLGHPVNSGFGYISNGYDSRLYGQEWVSVSANYMPRGQGHGFYRYGNEYADGLNELNRGPRAKLRNLSRPTSFQDNSVAQTQLTAEEKVQLSESAIADSVNLPDFHVDYADAKFFIIKSYSEDDVHKSVKYNVWASTPNGNKKLDAAFKQAQEKLAPCPVFLFFSVNASGQFVGVAEMVGSVDFNKNLEYWQQDKWNGCFSLKWHIVKDVPNSLLKHITIQSNENKPVTNSRDTQEVNLDQGLQMLKIFKEHSSRTSILDDFEFYESRQKAIQEKKVRIQFQKQVWEGTAVNLKTQDLPEHVTANGIGRSI